MPLRAADSKRFTQGAKTAISPNWTTMSMLFNVVLPYQDSLTYAPEV